MRSRNGNRLVVFPSLALICTLSFGADHYYIGYRLTTQNAQASEERLDVSRAMQPCAGSGTSSLSLPRLSNDSLASILNRDRDRFLEYATAGEYRLKSNLILRNSQIRTLQTLTLPTKCYAVEFNDDLVTISLLQ